MTTDNLGTTTASRSGVRLCHTHQLGSDERSAIRGLCDLAFAGDFSDQDFDHALGGLHVLRHAADGALVGHAALVQRSMSVGERALRCGYVEAVAVHPDHQRLGIGDAVMRVVNEVVTDTYDFGGLAASEAGRALYLRRGWVPWLGELSVFGPSGPSPTPEDMGAVFTLAGVAGELDRSLALAADWRAGEIW